MSGLPMCTTALIGIAPLITSAWLAAVNSVSVPPIDSPVM